MPQFEGPILLKLGISAKFSDQTWKNLNATSINALIGSIFWNTNISCHGTFKVTIQRVMYINRVCVSPMLVFLLLSFIYTCGHITVRMTNMKVLPEKHFLWKIQTELVQKNSPFSCLLSAEWRPSVPQSHGAIIWHLAANPPGSSLSHCRMIRMPLLCLVKFRKYSGGDFTN